MMDNRNKEQLKESLKHIKRQIKDGKAELKESIKKDKEKLAKDKKSARLRKRSKRVYIFVEDIIELVGLDALSGSRIGRESLVGFELG